MEIFGVSLTDRQNQTIFAASCAGTLASKFLFDQLVKPVVPDYRFSFLRSQTAVSLGLAAYTTLKIMELAKLIPSIPLPYKIIGGASLFALFASAGVAWRKAAELEDPLETLRHHCEYLRGANGSLSSPFHFKIELKNSGQNPPPIVHIIYNPYRGDQIHLSLKDKDRQALENIHCVLICSADISSYQEEIDNIKKATFGSTSPDCFRVFSSANLIEQSVSIVHKNRDKTYLVKEIPERTFYLTLVSKKDNHASANK